MTIGCKNGTTSSMRCHLKVKHPALYEKMMEMDEEVRLP
jgi:hypothetical protein